MSEQIDVVEQAKGANAITSAKSATTTRTGSAEAFDEAMMASTTVGSMGDLKSQAPDLYDAVMKGIAQNIIKQMKHHTDRFREIMRESRRY